MSIDSNLTIYTAAQVKLQLLERLNACDELKLDLTQVGEMDGAGVQLLLLAQREAHARHKRFTLQGVSPAVRDVLQLCRIDIAAAGGQPNPGKQA